MIAGNDDVLFPPFNLSSTLTPSYSCHADNKLADVKKKHTGCGSNPLSTVLDLMANKENWQNITVSISGS